MNISFKSGLVKLDNGMFINPTHVVSIEYKYKNDKQGCRLDLINGSSYSTEKLMPDNIAAACIKAQAESRIVRCDDIINQ